LYFFAEQLDHYWTYYTVHHWVVKARKRTLKEHGQFILGRTKQVVLFAGQGPWNNDALLRGTRELSQIIKEVDKSQPWAQMSFIYGEGIMPPETYQYFAKQTKVRQKLGLSALAVVIQDSSVSALIRRQQGEAYEQAHLDYAFFDNTEQAIAWLAQRHFAIADSVLQTFFANCSFIK
jgi:hypothetical protein